MLGASVLHVYINRRGFVIVPQSTPTVLNSRVATPLLSGKTTVSWSRSTVSPLRSVARRYPRILPVPTTSRVENCSFTVKTSLTGGTVGAVNTVSESIKVDVCVVVVTEVTVVVVVAVVSEVVVLEVAVTVVVIIGIAMLNVALAKRAAVDESPTGKVYMYTRGEVTPHRSTPSVDKITTACPLLWGSTRSNLGPIRIVAPVSTESARRNARS